MRAAFDRYGALVRELPQERFGEIREVGRQRLETTAVSPAIHSPSTACATWARPSARPNWRAPESYDRQGNPARMHAIGNPAARQGMARFGVNAVNVIGVSVPQLRAMARSVGRSQPLAEELWSTGIHDARILASLVGEPDKITRSTMDRWARDFESWDICDGCCCNLFDRTPYAWQKIRKWAPDKREFVRRAAFSTLAGLAVR